MNTPRSRLALAASLLPATASLLAAGPAGALDPGPGEFYPRPGASFTAYRDSAAGSNYASRVMNSAERAIW